MINDMEKKNMKIIDLSMPLYTGMDVFPGDPDVKINIIHTHENNGWELRKLNFGSHTGTHVDAFSHMHPGMTTIDEIPLENFFGKAQVVKRIDEWPNEIGLFFTEEIGAEYLDKLLNVRPRFVGGEITEELERQLLKHEIITYTNLVNLERIPFDTQFIFYGFPLNIQGGDGSPVRAVAVLES
jgi:kynurenine formamidase